MRILAVSDTHGRVERLAVLARAPFPVDCVFHLGDAESQEDLIRSFFSCPVCFVKGNCDTFSREEENVLMTLENRKFFLTHGHKYGVSYTFEKMVREGLRRGAEAVCFGHTHRPLIMEQNGILLVNPGSLTFPRQADRKPTFALIEFEREGRIRADILEA